MRVAPNRVVPIGDATVAVKDRRYFRHHGGTKRLPAMFLIAHPLHAHWSVRKRTRNQRSVRSGVVSTIVAVAARTFHMDAAHLIRRQSQQFSNGLLIGINPLAVGPDRNTVMVRTCNRT